MRNLPFLIILLTLLAGCGQKGPLYLPEELESLAGLGRGRPLVQS